MVDTNSTSAAVQTLAALGGHGGETGKAVAWLKSVQNKDGGWGYTAGGASDANSTSAAIGALAAVGTKPADVSKGGKSPYDALVKLSIPCGGDRRARSPTSRTRRASSRPTRTRRPRPWSEPWARASPVSP